MGRAVEGRLLPINETLREDIAENAGRPLEADVAAAVLWRLEEETDEAESLHVLTREELALLTRQSLEILLDAVAADPRTTNLPADHPVTHLVREWRKRKGAATEVERPDRDRNTGTRATRTERRRGDSRPGNGR